MDPEKFRAGHEKIASDLAFDLRLPVPPAVLWRRPDTPDDVEQCVNISLVPFHPINKWDLVRRVPKTAERVGRMLSSPASAMIVFDTWIANGDVANVGNLLVGEEALAEPQPTQSDQPTSGAEGEALNAAGSGDRKSADTPESRPKSTIRTAYIDYAYSMSKQWTGRDSYQSISPAPIYPEQAGIDRGVLEATITAIEGMPDKDIEYAVSRVPDDFLASDRRKITIDGLLYRKENLRTALAALLNEE